MADDDHMFSNFLKNHEPQLVGIPKQFWKSLSAKLKNETFDAGNYFALMQDEEDNKWHVVVTAEDGVSKGDPNSIFLIDHAWTYEINYARSQLKQLPNLAKRMANMMDIPYEESETEKVVDDILRVMWKYNNAYHIKSAALVNGSLVYENFKDDESYVPLWYVMDEFGSRVQHSDGSNVIFKSFLYVDTGVSFTVMFPTKDLCCDNEIFRDYVAELTDDAKRDARLYPWLPDRLNVEEITDDCLEKMFEDSNFNDEVTITSDDDVSKDVSDDDVVYKVFSTCKFTNEYLTDKHFEFTKNEAETDILYTFQVFEDWSFLTESNIKFFSQHPNEMILTCKDLFAQTAMRSLVYKYKKLSNVPRDCIINRGPLWLPTTFNLHSELPQFIKYFKEKENRKEKNVWIVKPWNLARSLDHTVTDNLDQIIRLTGAGPRVACRYVDNPVLFFREDIGRYVKQEFRFHILVKSVQPYEVYMHDHFNVRFAFESYEPKDYSLIERHFTYLWSRPGVTMLRMTDEEYIPKFEKQNPNFTWKDTLKSIMGCFSEFMRSATMEPPPKGLGRMKQCVGFYGFDVLLEWLDEEHTRIQPILIEANFCPDVTRAAKDRPSFMNDIFRMFFLNKQSESLLKL